MGLTTLLSNSQDRDFGPYPSINKKMIPEKLRTSFKSSTNYVEKIPDIKVDVPLLLQEFETIKTENWIESKIQTKLCVYHFNWKEFTNSMPYTQSVINGLRVLMPYNSVYYRYVHSNTCYNWHVDKMQTCLHIPLITNEGCKFVYDDAVFSMPADGSVYIVNNGKHHSFMNGGKQSRLHITMDIF
jgi:Aspartyl/Asparaginyl beta-hydroxylase